MARSIAYLSFLMALAGSVGCSSDDSDSESDDAKGGSENGGGSTGGSGGSTIPVGGTTTGGATSSGGATSTGGSTSSGGSTSTGGTGGGAMGTQPLGAICANDSNCSQTEGLAVCCVNTCTLAEGCPTNPMYLPCESKADCDAYGGGKLCCEMGEGQTLMRFCTKQSACSGRVLP